MSAANTSYSPSATQLSPLELLHFPYAPPKNQKKSLVAQSSFWHTPLRDSPWTVSTTPTREINDQNIAKPWVGAMGCKGIEVVGDVTDHISRGVRIAELLSKPGSSTGMAPIGLVSGLSLIAGAHDLQMGAREFKEAFINRDSSSLYFGALQGLKGLLVCIGGAVYIPARALSIGTLLAASKAASVAALVLGRVGDGLFIGSTLLMMINLAGKIHEQRQVSKGIDPIIKDPELSPEVKAQRVVEYLQGLLGMSEEESEKIRSSVENGRKYAKMPKEKRDEVIEQKLWTALSEKEGKLKRLLGAECVKQIKGALPGELQTIVEKVKKVILEKRIINGSAISLAVVGIIASMAAFFLTAPAALIALASIGLVTSLGWIGIDGYDLFQSFKEKDAGRFDQLIILVSALVALISITLLFVFTGGIVPLVAGSVIGAVWLGINIYSLYNLRKKAED